MKKNVRGLSSIVTTLIIILLVLVATAIIWGVVSNLLNKNVNTIDKNTKCLDIDIRATKVVPVVNSSGSYTVTLSRSSTGDEEAFYAKLVFSNSTDTSAPIDFTIGLTPLLVKSLDVNSSVPGADRLEVTPYFTDDSGNVLLCDSKTVFEF